MRYTLTYLCPVLNAPLPCNTRFLVLVYFTLILISVIYTVILFVRNVLIPVTKGGTGQISHLFVHQVLLFIFSLLLDHEFIFIIRLKA